jgi:membrane-bound serine protease (ClpP class)
MLVPVGWVLTVALLGLLCIFAEVFLPGGVLGVLGWLLIGISFVGAYNFWNLTPPFFLFVAGFIGAGVLLYALAIKLMPKTAVGKLIFLRDTQKGYNVSVSSDRELVGKEGIALSYLRPSGVAVIDGKRVNVVADGEFIEQRSRIKVTEFRDNQLVVHKIEKNNGNSRETESNSSEKIPGGEA